MTSVFLNYFCCDCLPKNLRLTIYALQATDLLLQTVRYFQLQPNRSSNLLTEFTTVLFD